MSKNIVFLGIVFLLFGCGKEITKQDIGDKNQEKIHITDDKIKGPKKVEIFQRENLYNVYSLKIKEFKTKNNFKEIETIKEEITNLEIKKIKEIDIKIKMGNKKDVFYLKQDLKDIFHLKQDFF